MKDRIGPLGWVSMLVAAVTPFTGAPVWVWLATGVVAFLVVPIYENSSGHQT